MKLDFIPLDKLSVSKTNMRYAKKAPDVSDILPTIRKRGVIQPLIVRPNPCPERVEGCASAARGASMPPKSSRQNAKRPVLK